ncbi:MAG: HAMP domain-containing histidine kinase [Clostridia bacterium]|nr:HAMP domain-containing histidine kinase [Clostridia bacterium]
MIRRLRTRMTLMVVAVLILVSAGIVLATHLSNERNIAAQAQDTLSVLAENGGTDESRKDNPPPKPDDDDGGNRFGRKNDRRGGRGTLPEIRSGGDAAKAGLSSSYTITLNEDGSVSSWTSDRADLYSDEQIADVAQSILADGKDAGRTGTQFYRKTDNRLIVLDARLDFLSASNTLRSTVLIAAASCILLSLLAWLLIRRMVRPVEEAFNKQKQFVSDASHELKTPLAIISANAEVLGQDIGENEYLGYIRSEVRRTDTLVNSLLALARLDKGAAETAMKPFDLSRALLDVTLPFESTVYETGKTMETSIPDGIGCTGNEEQIKQLAVILLSNALKYSDEGGRIEVSLKARGKQREIRVFNTGSAVSPEDREHIFDRFWRADPAHGRETGGHGLGLAIAKAIADAHRGKIAVESGDGSGTAFTVTLNA